MTVWTGQYIQVAGVNLADLENTTFSSGISLTPVYVGDDQDGNLDDNVGDTINGSEVVTFAQISGPLNIRVDGVDYSLDWMIGMELANGDVLLGPYFLTNTSLIEALHYGGTIEEITLGSMNFSSSNNAGEFYNLIDEPTVHGTTGDDVIGAGYVDGGEDEIDGADGDDDTVDAGPGNDTIQSFAGNDFILAGEGNDVLSGGAGDDSLTGGDGDDVFNYSVGDGNDTISDFNFGNSGALNDGNTANNDFIDLSTFYDSLSELRADFNDDGILNQSNALDTQGNPVDYSDNDQFGGGSLTFEGMTANGFTNDNTGVVCFTSGTLILTPKGEVPIDTLRVGDLVVTMDNGPQPIIWIGRRRIGKRKMATDERLRPVMIRQGVLGARRDLFLSRQHGVLIGKDHHARAVHLADTLSGARIAHGKREAVYFHLMFEAHQIIFSEGMPSESFYPGPSAMGALQPAARKEVLDIFPELRIVSGRAGIARSYGHKARAFLGRKSVCAEQAATRPVSHHA